MKPKRLQRKKRGFTLIELVVAMGLLSIGVIPLLRALTAAQAVGTKAQRATVAHFRAEEMIEDIRADALEHFDTNFNASSMAVSGGYLCTITDVREGSLSLGTTMSPFGWVKTITVDVGFDVDDDGILHSSEIDATFQTRIARKTGVLSP